MKNFMSKLGSTFSVCAFILAAVAFVACGKDEMELMGKFKPMKWQKNDYPTVEKDRATMFVVPAEGESYSFTCENYNPLHLTGVLYTGEGWNLLQEPELFGDSAKVSDDFCDVLVKGNTVKVAVKPCSSQLVKIKVMLQHGNALGELEFVQMADEPQQ